MTVSLGEKKLRHFVKGSLITEIAISSGKNPPSCREGSFGTPLGLHAVAEKFGDGAPPGTVFIGRENTGHCYWEREDAGPDQKMYVTTRILWLKGLEPGINSGPGIDSYQRYIYIHGTCHPERFPENLSGGCITPLDDDLIALHQAIPEGSMVWIEK